MIGRRTSMIIGMVVGALALAGAVGFAIGGAGRYGTPFQGDAFFNITLALVLLLGPCAILPCTMYEIRRPQWGGIMLCSLALIDVLMIVANNQGAWGFAMHNAALAAFGITLPMFLIGSLLFFSTRPLRMGLHGLWYVELMAALMIAGYFTWQVGADGLSALIHWFKGGTI